MIKVELRPALPREAATLSEIAMRSKAHWGYGSDFLEACRAELTIQPAWCDGIRLVVAERADNLLGFHRLSGMPPQGVLEALFVDEAQIGTGVGRLLFDDAAKRARQLGMSSLLIDADPGAAPFYQHMGAVPVGQSPSGSIAGRILPQLRLVL